jgi:hypothetical protein
MIPRGNLIGEFIEELENIAGLLSGMVEVVFYSTDSSYLQQKFPHANVKVPTTPKQKLYANMERLAIAAATNKKTVPIIKCKLKIPGDNTRAWILTHHPLDLISRYEFSELTLLSSHTGSLKKPVEWIAKLTANPEYLNMPFNLLTIQVVGDRATQFKAGSAIFRKMLLNVAKGANWKPTTTRSKVNHDLDKIIVPDVRDIFKKMLNVKLT